MQIALHYQHISIFKVREAADRVLSSRKKKTLFLLKIRFPEFYQNIFNSAMLKRNQGLNPSSHLKSVHLQAQN